MLRLYDGLSVTICNVLLQDAFCRVGFAFHLIVIEVSERIKSCAFISTQACIQELKKTTGF